MIHLDLGMEPSELASIRETCLRTALDAFNAHGVGSAELTDALDEGYKAMKAELRKRQHGKCAYCEVQEDAYKRPVEHFRPKNGAQNHAGGSWTAPDKEYYWWLCWSWENLFFSCDTCNQPGHKGNRFPIEGTTRIPHPTRPQGWPLAASFFDTSGEDRLLVDPRIDDPLDHLRWKLVDPSASPSMWEWTIVGRTPRGRMTESVLNLRRRLDLVNTHLKGAFRTAWIAIDGHIKAGRLDEARPLWDGLVTDAIENPDQPFRGATWWALDTLCPPDKQAEYGFRCPPRPDVKP